MESREELLRTLEDVAEGSVSEKTDALEVLQAKLSAELAERETDQADAARR